MNEQMPGHGKETGSQRSGRRQRCQRARAPARLTPPRAQGSRSPLEKMMLLAAVRSETDGGSMVGPGAPLTLTQGLGPGAWEGACSVQCPLGLHQVGGWGGCRK